MTTQEYEEGLSLLTEEMHAAIDSGDDDRVLGVKMAVEAFIEVAVKSNDPEVVRRALVK